MTFSLYVNGCAVTHALTLAQVAEMLQLDPHEVSWAIEEFGKAQTLDCNGCEILIVASGGDNG